MIDKALKIALERIEALEKRVQQLAKNVATGYERDP